MKALSAALIMTLMTLSLLVPHAQASNDDKEALAKKLLELTDVSTIMDNVYKSVRTSQIEKLEEVDYPGKSDQKDAVLIKRVTDYLDRTLQWHRFEQGYAEVYSDFFTEDELRQAVVFYQSSVARKLISNDRALKTLLLESTQLQMRDLAIKLKQLENIFIKEQTK